MLKVLNLSYGRVELSDGRVFFDDIVLTPTFVEHWDWSITNFNYTDGYSKESVESLRKHHTNINVFLFSTGVQNKIPVSSDISSLTGQTSQEAVNTFNSIVEMYETYSDPPPVCVGLFLSLK